MSDFIVPEPGSGLSARAIESWDANARFWDATITKHGNKYWRRLQEPSLARLLGPTLSSKPDCKALDLATGNGLCARWLVRNGARSVVAADASVHMLDLVRGYCEADREVDGRVSVSRVDVTREDDLKNLVQSEGSFDVVLMNMAIMDVADLQPLARAMKGLLAEGGV